MYREKKILENQCINRKKGELKLDKKKKIISMHTFSLLYWKQIAEDAPCIFFFEFYAKFPFNPNIIICISELRKKYMKHFPLFVSDIEGKNMCGYKFFFI